MNVLETMFAMRRRAVERGARAAGGWGALMAAGIGRHWGEIGRIFEGANVRWGVIGAVACRSYKPERSTRDIDVIVLGADVLAASRALEHAGFGRLRSLVFVDQPAWTGSAWGRASDGAVLDLWVVDLPWIEAALDAAASNRDVDELRVLPLPYLVLTKLESMRSRDVSDLSEMLGIALRRGDHDVLRHTRELVRAQYPDREEELDQLIQLGEWDVPAE